MEIAHIMEAIRAGRVRVTDHADEEATADGLTYADVAHSALHGEIIEDYPGDRPYPNCLILGKTRSGIAVHSVCAHKIENRWAVLVKVYRPDPQRWVNWRERRKPK